MSARPPDAPAHYDLVLLVMGLALFAGLVGGIVSTVPLRYTGSAGSLVAAGVLFGSILYRPPTR